MDLQTLGSQLVMPKNLLDHYSRHHHGYFNKGHDLILNIGSYLILNKISYIKVAWLYAMDTRYILLRMSVKTKVYVVSFFGMFYC